MRPFPAGLMRMWPISTRVNKPENDDASIIEPIQLAQRADIGHDSGTISSLSEQAADADECALPVPMSV